MTHNDPENKVMFYAKVELHLASEEIDNTTSINDFIVAESVEFKSHSYVTYRDCLNDSVGFLESKKAEWEDKFPSEYRIYALENPAYSKRRDQLFPNEDGYWTEDMMVSLVLVDDNKPKDPWIIRATIKAFHVDIEPETFYVSPNDTVH